MDKREMATIATALDFLLQSMVNTSVLSERELESLNKIIEDGFNMQTESITIDDAKIVIDYITAMIFKYKEGALINKED